MAAQDDNLVFYPRSQKLVYTAHYTLSLSHESPDPKKFARISPSQLDSFTKDLLGANYLWSDFRDNFYGLNLAIERVEVEPISRITTASRIPVHFTIISKEFEMEGNQREKPWSLEMLLILNRELDKAVEFNSVHGAPYGPYDGVYFDLLIS